MANAASMKKTNHEPHPVRTTPNMHSKQGVLLTDVLLRPILLLLTAQFNCRLHKEPGSHME
jgi:hypothetical protein